MGDGLFKTTAGRRVYPDRKLRVNPGNHHQRGTALVMVLFISLFLSVILAGSFAAVHIQAKSVAAGEELLKLELAAKSGLELAAFKIATKGRYADEPLLPMMQKFGEIEVIIDWSPEMKKIDINLADETVLAGYFTQKGLLPRDAEVLAARIADWRDRDNLSRVNGAESRDYANTPDNVWIGNRGFRSLTELEAVLGFNDFITDICMESDLTVLGTAGQGAQGSSPVEAETSSTITIAGIAGERLSLVATASTDGNIAPQSWQGVFRIVGRPERPMSWILKQHYFEEPETNCTVKEQD